MTIYPEPDPNIEPKKNVIYEDENKALKKRIVELSALLYQVLEQVDSDLFNDHVTNTQRQNIIRMIKQRVPLTAEILAIVNKSKQESQQSVNNQE